MAFLMEQTNLAELDALSPQELLRWAVEHYGQRAGLVTSFQLTGCVMIDMAQRTSPGLRIITVDTLRLFPETYQLIDRIEQRYGITVERFTPDPDQLAKMLQQHGEYLFFDSKAKQEYCCQIRKVEPNERVLETLDVWISGLRRDQSESRRATPRVSVVRRGGSELLKLCPLADWTEGDVRAYIRDHDVPYNPLYDNGYESIGCVICSTPALPWEDKRAGRWRWFNQFAATHPKECGIHTHGSGI